MNLDLAAIAAQHNLRKRGAVFSGPCPKCGGGKSSDKFVLKLDGGFKCYGCDFKGDAITWLREMEGKTCAEAHAIAGMECRATTCPVQGTCRFGDGSGKPARQARSVAPAAPGRKATVPVMEIKHPAGVWLAWATGLAAQAEIDLRQQPDQLAWLDGRGIGPEAVRRFGLGWLNHDRRVVRSSIGLGTKEDGKDKLWVPGGLVIPIFTADGSMHRLRIRRTPEARAKFLADRKYMWVEGSGNEPMVIHPDNRPSRGVVVVEAELDAMAVASAHHGVTVIALGTVSGGMPEWLRAECAASAVILVALDADPGGPAKAGAGPKAISSWVHTYVQARFWPVPAGKDPGDYVSEHGGDLRAWIEAGLPPEVAVGGETFGQITPVEEPASIPAPSSAQDVAFSPGCSSAGGSGFAETGDCKDVGGGSVGESKPSEMAAFIGLLQMENGMIWRNEYEVFVRYQRPQCASAESSERRRLITTAIYGGGTVAWCLELLPRGQFAPAALVKFFKGA